MIRHVVRIAIGLVMLVGTKALTQEFDAQTAALQPYAPPPATDPADWPNERMIQWMRELTQYVVDHHLITDPNRRIYGQAIEFYRDGKQFRTFGLNSMHDGAWLAGALALAHRVDPDGPYLGVMQKYLVPFYTNTLNNSDVIFPNKKLRQGQDRKPLQEPIKGWLPRGWDDGESYDPSTGRQYKTGEFQQATNPDTAIDRDAHGMFVQAYFTPSNHLAQYTADGLLNVFFTTRDPAIAAALKNLNAYRVEYFSPVPTWTYPAGFANDNDEQMNKADLPKLSPEAVRSYYQGSYQQAGGILIPYFDRGLWSFHRAVAEYLRGKRLDAETMWALAFESYAIAMMQEYYHDDRPYRYGLHHFEIARPVKFVPETGKLDKYKSDGGNLYGGMGIMMSLVGTATLPALRQHPELWEQPYHRDHADETLVRMVDNPPTTDGRRDKEYDRSQTIQAGGTEVSLISDPEFLHVFMTSASPQVKLTFGHAADANVHGDRYYAVIEVTSEGAVKVMNNAGGDLLHVAKFVAGPAWSAELRLPYNIVNGQARWTTAVEHGRYDVAINDRPAATVYVMSTPQRIIDRLEKIGWTTVQTWRDVYEQIDRLPSAWRTHDLKVERWEASDVSTINHIIMQMAYLMIDRAGTSEWQIIRNQWPAGPIPADPLPDSVLKIQGLK